MLIRKAMHEPPAYKDVAFIIYEVRGEPSSLRTGHEFEEGFLDTFLRANVRNISEGNWGIRPMPCKHRYVMILTFESSQL